jgi:alanine racemase
MTASAQLTIDLDAIAANYRHLQAVAGPGTALTSRVAAVVKADAYGLGIARIAETLRDAGAGIFFVATPEEGIALRAVVPGKIAVLNGFFPQSHDAYAAHRLIPVLGSRAQIAEWDGRGENFWQVDTGMNRMGLRVDEMADAARDFPRPALLMSHLACADESDHPMNAAQLAAFRDAARHLPGQPLSLANSSGLFLGPEYRFDLARPGMALYGLNPTPDRPNPMRPVVGLETRILRLSVARGGETIGYGAGWTCPSDRRLATASLGYADGFLRAGTNRAALYWHGHACPVRGRVSMDLIVVDVTELPGHLPPPREGDWLEAIGESQDADALADSMGTIGYEVLTRLAPRLTRIYKQSGRL